MSAPKSATHALVILTTTFSLLAACSDPPPSSPAPLPDGFVNEDAGADERMDTGEPEPIEDVVEIPDTPVEEETPDPVEPPRVPFDDGPAGLNIRELAGDFTLQTTEGPWRFSQAWTGRDSTIFLQYTNDPQQPENLRNFLEALWFGGGRGEIEALLSRSPPNVHFFFTSFDQDAEEDVLRIKALVDEVLGDSEPLRAAWQGRVHFVTEQIWNSEGWVGAMLRNTGWLWFGIDPSQRLRQLGGLFDPGRGTPRLSAAAHEATYFDFELRRQLALDAEGPVTIVPLYVGERIGSDVRDIELPSAEAMAGFDTMELDVSAFCPEHLDANCGEWDYLSHFYVCDVPVEAVNPHAETACQPHVQGREAVAEVLGVCAGTEDPCRAAEDCGQEVACEGYTAPVEGIEAVEADTIACACDTAYGKVETREHVCNNEGTGYGACNCPCGTEIGRWITTYGREGRWVTDISPFLGFFKRGGQHRLRMNSGNAYDFDFSIRLSNKGKGHKPSEIRPLWGGGGFNQNYNTTREPFAFEAPEGTTRVEVVAYITGHGWGVERANCAEFCNHTHHFEINGDAYVKEHPEAGTAEGCVEQVASGVVPNQYGTWPYGRGGWCPGLDVKPWVADITASLQPGENTLTYRGLFRGVDYVPEPSGGGNGGFGANINMSAYLVFYSE